MLTTSNQDKLDFLDTVLEKKVFTLSNSAGCNPASAPFGGPNVYNARPAPRVAKALVGPADIDKLVVNKCRPMDDHGGSIFELYPKFLHITRANEKLER